ncbi:MAG: hypothetical protein Ct9H300mP19_00720 [Dehalococcoidia bacterium]|nr:MAG: hypothetical protein Ct9H300mP19_00720 [Dehalococcoidia bacterium]
MAIANEGERVAYFNGEIVPESEVKVPFREGDLSTVMPSLI